MEQQEAPSTTAAAGAGSEGGAGSGGASSRTASVRRTTLNRTWLIKVVIMTLLCFGFGSWGLYDATIKYPEIGEEYASYMEYEYLRTAEQVVTNGEDRRMFSASRLSIPEPAAKLEGLRERMEDNLRDAANEESDRHFRAQMELAQQKWLTGLSRINELEDTARLQYSDDESSDRAPAERLQDLRAEWVNKPQPRPLEVYDLPLQWAIMVVSYGFTLYLLFLLARVGAKSYAWDPVTRRLYLPGEKVAPAGASEAEANAGIVPDDIDEVDKRQWSKFLVYLKIRGDHPRYPGRELKFDLYRYARLEDWILEMEAEVFDEEEDEAEPGGRAGTAGAASTPSREEGASPDANGSAGGPANGIEGVDSDGVGAGGSSRAP